MKLNKNKFKIAVLCGGFEPESYASNLTGKNILKALINAGFKKAYILNVDKNVVINLLDKRPDFAFLAMFCKWGEDGVIQSLLETLSIPYSGSGVETSSLCKNKFLFNRFVAGCGLSSPENYFYGDKNEFVKFNTHLIKFPCIIKAVYQGYSLGTSVVHKLDELDNLSNKAFAFSSKITIEEFIEGREFTVGIVDKLQKDNNIKKITLPIIEIKFKNNHIIQSTEVKDDPNLMKEIVPANLTKTQQKQLEDESLILYKKSGCYGVARFDIRLSSRNNKFYFLENNTCPGILSYKHSDLPKQLKAKNISLEWYVQNMIKIGLIRPENKIEQYLN